jgi:hypothetical protein
MALMPQYPVYVISKGRADVGLTANFLLHDGVPFHLVIEPQEEEEYAKYYDRKLLLILPFSNLGLGSIPARNWVWEHAKEAGHKRHWILDDNIYRMYRYYRGKRVRVSSGVAFKVVEDFTERYTNIAIAGMNYTTFVGLGTSNTATKMPPFYLNAHVYSCLLIDNDLPHRWRGRYNEDTDLCLQVLADGLCTVLFNAFCQQKAPTMTIKGGNTDKLYKGDGRLEMARSLERQWPYVVTVGRRYDRPQHVVHNQWQKFDTQLIRRTDIDWDSFQPNDYGLELVQVKDNIKSERVKNLLQAKDSDALTDAQTAISRILLMESVTEKPKYPIYIPSRQRADTLTTAKLFQSENIPFKVVVEPQDAEDYRKHFSDDNLLVMDKNDQGIAYVRNFIREHSIKSGAGFHWQFDDNIKNFAIRQNDKNTPESTIKVLHIAETVNDLYSNIGGVGLYHQAFAFSQTRPILVNKQVYSAMLLNNSTECAFRDGTVEDTDYSLQMLTKKYCTLLFTMLIMNKATTDTMKGGNTEISYSGDGRLQRSLKLQELWPNAFKIVEKNGKHRIAPSRIWQTFEQIPKRVTDGS